jgi:AbiU2
MSNNVGEQKLLIVNAVLDLNKKLKAIKYILDKAKQPESKIALEIFDELFEFIYLLLWESVVINVSWLYEKDWKLDKNGKRIKKKETRSLYWYLEEEKKSFPAKTSEFDTQIAKMESLEITVNKVRSVRDKWVAHRDKKAFENPSEFLKGISLKLEDVKILIETADEIVLGNLPISDLTSTGIHRLFWAIEFADMLPEKIEEIKHKIKLQERI